MTCRRRWNYDEDTTRRSPRCREAASGSGALQFLYRLALAICAIDTGCLKIRGGHVKNLIFTASPQRVWRHYGVLRPTKNSSHVDFLDRDVGNLDMFR